MSEEAANKGSAKPEGSAKRVRGVVKSDKMDKSITVRVERLVKHPMYGKYLRRDSAFMAHDPENVARAGDLVEIESTRPLSARKRWRLVRVIRRAADIAIVTAAEGEPTIEDAPATGA